MKRNEIRVKAMVYGAIANIIVDSDGIIFIINNLNNVISVIDKLTGKVKSMTGDLSNVGALIGLLASMKNVGKPKMSGFCLIMPTAQFYSLWQR